MVEMGGGMRTPALWTKRVSQDVCSWSHQVRFVGGIHHREGATIFAPFSI
jgi:hypothetical protein